MRGFEPATLDLRVDAFIRSHTSPNSHDIEPNLRHMTVAISSHWSRSADSIVAERIRKRSLLLDDLEEYTNSSECLRIRSATVESAERDQFRLSTRTNVSIVQFFIIFLINSTSKSFPIVYNLIVEKDFKICKGN